MTDNKIIVKTFPELTTTELYEILKARFEVFVMEQKCFYLDMDDIDYSATHIFIWDCTARHVLAYTRLFPEEFAPTFAPPATIDDVWHFGRLLTVDRGVGNGKKMIETVLKVAEKKGAKILRMEAQCHAIGLYENFGFSVVSAPFEEAGIMHVEMEKRVGNDL